MLLMDELNYLRLYPAKRKVHIPVNLDNKRKGAAIMLLTKNSVDSHTLMNMPYMFNPGLYKSLYIDRNINAMIDSGAIIDDEPVNESYLVERTSDAISKIFAFHDEIMNSKDYAFNVSPTDDRFGNNFELASPNEFKKLTCPTCWDYAVYEADYFNKNISNVKFETYFVYVEDNAGLPNHTFLVFHMNNKHYLFECCMARSSCGIYEADSIKDIFNHVYRCITKGDTSNPYHLYQYNALDKKIYGMKPLEFIDDYIPGNGTRISFRYSNNFNIRKITKEEFLTEAMQHVTGPKKISIVIDCMTGNKNDETLMRSVYTENRFLKWYRYFKAKERHIENHVKVSGYRDTKSLGRGLIGAALKDERSGIIMNSYSTPGKIAIVTNSFYGPLKAKEGPNWEKYAENELITYVIMNSCKNCSRYLAGQVASVLSGQFGANEAKRCENFGEVTDEGLATCYVIYQLYKDQGQRGIVRLCKSGDVSILATYASKRFIERMKTNLGINESASFEDDSADLALKAEILDVVDNLSDKERGDIAIHGVYNISDPDISKTIVRRNDDGKVVGFLDLHHFKTKPYNGYITIAVDPNYRGQGIGKQMVDQLLQSAPIPNINRYIWHVDPANEPSVNLAKSCGFTSNGITRHRTDLDIDEDEYEYAIPFREAARVPIPYRVISESAGEDHKYICNEDYITDSNFITFFNGMDDVITEAEKKYDSRLKRFLFAQRLKNNKMVALRYEEMKAMNPWITRTYLKLPMYKQLNLFIDLSYYHGLFMNNMNYKRDMALNMYWDFLNRLINDTEYKSQYKKITIFLPVWASAWGVETVDELIDYTKSINPISLIFRYLRKKPDELKKWGNKDIVFMGTNGYFKVNFGTIVLKDMAKINRLITKVFNNEDISEDETADGYGPREDDVDSPAAITASIINKIEKRSNIKIDNLVGDNNQNQYRSEELDVLKPTVSQFTHLRIRTGSFDLPSPSISARVSKQPEGEEVTYNKGTNAVMIITPSEDESIKAFIASGINKNLFGKKGFYKP